MRTVEKDAQVSGGSLCAWLGYQTWPVGRGIMHIRICNICSEAYNTSATSIRSVASKCRLVDLAPSFVATTQSTTIHAYSSFDAPDNLENNRHDPISDMFAVNMYSIESSNYPYLTLLLVLGISCAALIQFLSPVDLKWSIRSKGWAMPPGPPGLPVLGNLQQMMAARSGPTAYVKWVRLNVSTHQP